MQRQGKSEVYEKRVYFSFYLREEFQRPREREEKTLQGVGFWMIKAKALLEFLIDKG